MQREASNLCSFIALVLFVGSFLMILAAVH
jgi:hypothetical protein